MQKEYLKNGKLDLTPILTDCRNQWNQILGTVSGKKLMVVTEYTWKLHNFVLDDVVYEDTRRVVVSTFLREYDTNADSLRSKYESWLFFIGNHEKTNFMDIAQVLSKEMSARKRSSTSSSNNNTVHLVIAPSKNIFFVEKLNIMKLFDVNFFKMHHVDFIIPYDNDVICLEINNVYKDIYIDEDESCLYKIASNLFKLEKLFGFLPCFYGKGNCLSRIIEILKKMEKQASADVEDKEETLLENPSCFDYAILLDRRVDLISPLVTQLTYEGLLSTLFDTTDTLLDYTYEKLGGNKELETASKKISLNSGDKMFSELRDKHFNAVGMELKKSAHGLSGQLEEHSDDMSVDEVRGYIRGLSSLLSDKKSLTLHTSLTERIKKIADSGEFLEDITVEQEFLNCIDNDKVSTYIEDMVTTQRPLHSVLRLISLQSLVSSGLKERVLDHYKWEVFNGYGLEGMQGIIQVEKAGLISYQENQRTYSVLRKALKLTMEDTSDINPTDIGYVHGAYAPITGRIIEHIVHNRSTKTKDFLDSLHLIPADTLNQTSIFMKHAHSQIVDMFNDSSHTRTVLVVFVGGCTFAEISALRFLGRQDALNINFIVVTTEILNSKTFLSSIMTKTI